MTRLNRRRFWNTSDSDLAWVRLGSKGTVGPNQGLVCSKAVVLPTSWADLVLSWADLVLSYSDLVLTNAHLVQISCYLVLPCADSDYIIQILSYMQILGLCCADLVSWCAVVTWLKEAWRELASHRSGEV